MNTIDIGIGTPEESPEIILPVPVQSTTPTFADINHTTHEDTIYTGQFDSTIKTSSPPSFPLTSTSLASTPGPAYKLPKFLRSLYSILEIEDPSIINWVQNKELRPRQVTAFHILQLQRFEQEILPKYFKHAKFASFQRQLNNFGFRKWTKTQSSGVCTFSHNSFPPDPNKTGVLRASIREQWKPVHTGLTRRRVGNGITMAERKLQEQVQQQQRKQQQLIHKPLETFSMMFKARLNASQDKEIRTCDKMERTHTWSCLPEPTQSPTPRTPYNNNTINLGTQLVQQGATTFDYRGTSKTTLQNLDVSKSKISTSMMVASPVEPWPWTPLSSMSNNVSNVTCPMLPQLDMQYATEGWPESTYTCQRLQVSPSSTEEFTFDNWMLFVE